MKNFLFLFVFLFSLTAFATPGKQLHLITILPSQVASNTFDLIGENHEFESQCNTACFCEYTYFNGTTSKTIVTPAYVQDVNLLQCKNELPTGVKVFDVKVLVFNSSNAVTVTLGR